MGHVVESSLLDWLLDGALGAAVDGQPVDYLGVPPDTDSGLVPDEEKAQLDALDENDRRADEDVPEPDDVGFPGHEYPR